MAQIRHDIVQPARPLTYDTEFEGLLRVGEASEVLAPSERGQAFRQILLSAEERTRVELWREYAPPDRRQLQRCLAQQQRLVCGR